MISLKIGEFVLILFVVIFVSFFFGVFFFSLFKVSSESDHISEILANNSEPEWKVVEK
jgi:hypothetical protein